MGSIYSGLYRLSILISDGKSFSCLQIALSSSILKKIISVRVTQHVDKLLTQVGVVDICFFGQLKEGAVAQGLLKNGHQGALQELIK